MPMRATVELKDLALQTNLGTYGPDDVVPEAHLLDLTLVIDPGLVHIAEDGMDHVFDYDPLIAEIGRLAGDGHYETQERLMTRILEACARLPEIRAVDLALTKTPVLGGTGVLGVRLQVDEPAMAEWRATL